MPQSRCPKVGWLKRSRVGILGLSALAWSMAGSPASAQLQPITFTPLDAHTTSGYATYGSHNQKVLVNQYGIFVAYLHQYGEPVPGTEKMQWRLQRSVDGGASFTTIDQSPDIYLPGNEYTYPPVLETDNAGNVYMLRQSPGVLAPAFLRIYRASQNFAPTQLAVIPNSCSQKYSMLLDEARGQIYYVAHTYHGAPVLPDNSYAPMWFYVIGLDGTAIRDYRLTQRCTPGAGCVLADASYPQLALDEQGVVYVAWSNVSGNSSGTFEHYSSYVMKSQNGGVSWQTLSGTLLSLPVVADGPGWATLISDAAELGVNQSKMLWGMLVKQGKLHFAYRNSGTTHQRYVRIDTATGQRDVNLTGWSGAGGTIHLNGLDGFCTAVDAVDNTVYCVGRRQEDNQPGVDGDRLGVLVSHDNGQTWQDFATSEHFGIKPYSITGPREIRDGQIVGMFTLSQGANQTVHFFRIPLTSPTTQRLHTVAVTTSNGALSGYPATNAIDANPQTLWVDASPNNNSWITLDLGTSKPIDRVRWLSGLGTPYPAYAPGTYTVSVSQDNQNWTQVAYGSNPLGVINGNEPVGMTARYVKLATTIVVDGSGWSLSFFEFWAEGTAMPATRLPATTGGVQTPGYETGKANDGRYDTRFIDSMTPAPQNNVATFDLYLGTYRQVARVKWMAATVVPLPAGPPRDFVIQVSDNGVNWTTIYTKSAPDSAGSTWEGNIPINRSVRQMRLLTSTVYDGSGWSLGFLEFWVEGW